MTIDHAEVERQTEDDSDTLAGQIHYQDLPESADPQIQQSKTAVRNFSSLISCSNVLIYLYSHLYQSCAEGQ
jgi:hypothetical protein